MVKKVKYIGFNVATSLTKRKIYEVVEETFGEIEIVDNDGDRCWFTKDNFEPIEEPEKTLLEYFMELHNLKEGDEFKINAHNAKIEDGKLLIKSFYGDSWVDCVYPLHFYDNVVIYKKRGLRSENSPYDNPLTTCLHCDKDLDEDNEYHMKYKSCNNYCHDKFIELLQKFKK